MKSEVIKALEHEIVQAELCTRRSDAYIDGLRQGVALRLTGSDILNPYAVGSAEHDAFVSGAQRGLHITERYSHAFTKRTGRSVPLHTDRQALRERLVRGRALAARIITALQEKGMGEALLIGSMASGTIHENSDIDILVLDCGALDPFFIAGEMVETDLRKIDEHDIKVDCIIPAIMEERDRQKWLGLADEELRLRTEVNRDAP